MTFLRDSRFFSKQSTLTKGRRFIHGGSGLHNRLEHSIWTHGDATFAVAAFLSVFNDHVLMKPDVHFPKYVMFAFVYTVPAGFTLTGICEDIFCPVSL